MKRLATILCLFTMCVAGCGAKETINEVDVKQATGLVLALALAGFDGDFNLEIRAVVEAYGKTSFGTESAGTSFGARGHINPAAVSPAKIQAILNAIEALGVGQPEVSREVLIE